VFGSLLVESAMASPFIHAHRGGALETRGAEQRAAVPENSLKAFETAAEAGFVLELDVKLTADGVAVVIHDATLERTTNCVGTVAAMTAAQLRAECEIDVIGTTGTERRLPEGSPRRTAVPTLAEALELAIRRRAKINLEIKNLPTEPDFDAGIPPAFATTVAETIKASGYPPSWLIVQSFYPTNLDAIEADPYFADAATSLLTLAPLNAGGPALADLRGYEWVSPAWPVDPGYIETAHALGLRVVPYTLDREAEIRAAANAGVDAMITNDPGLARGAIDAVEPPSPPVPPPPGKAACREVAAGRTAPAIESLLPQRGAPRVFALQFKQEIRNVTSYERFRTKIECMILDYVVPRLAKKRPNIVALNEDVGLLTLATGSRGAAARTLFGDGGPAPSCEPEGIPCGVVAALGAIATGYADQLALYLARFPRMSSVAAPFVAGTDTFARGWMQTFSDLAKRYGVYILGSNNQAPFRESWDPSEIALLADPDVPEPSSVFVATRPAVYNEVFLWGPEDVVEEGPRPLRNVVAQNKKVPLTSIEELLQLEPGPSMGPDARWNLKPFRVPGTKARVGFATSLPAFVYGHRLGEAAPAAGACADVSVTYMRCLDKLGTNLVIQDEANPGRWAGASGEGNWQPLEWMRSTWRAVRDRSVSFDYNVTPHMVGNLADLPFDGQTAITQRSRAPRKGRLGGAGCAYIGASRFISEAPEADPDYLRPYAGPKRQFLGIVEWVAADGSRAELRETARKLAPGSRDQLENDYLETAIVADLPFPPERERQRCG